jgi:hypothetical protein
VPAAAAEAALHPGALLHCHLLNRATPITAANATVPSRRHLLALN